MDNDTSSRFISSLVKSIQALCNGYVEFSSSIEVIGHIHLNIDRNVKLDYVLTEEVSKSVSDEDATVFSSHSYHSHPPSSVLSKDDSDKSSLNRQKSQTIKNESDTSGHKSSEVPNTSKSVSFSHNRHGESSKTFYSGSVSFSSDSDPTQQNNMQNASDKRRRSIHSSRRTPSPTAKRSRNDESVSNSFAEEQNSGFDVIEIKEEPDDEPPVCFGENPPLAAGQDIQTPDFSNVVMESLDRVGQIEGTQLVAGGGGDVMSRQQPFPVMLHSNAGMSSAGPVAGPSSDQQSAASGGGSEKAHKNGSSETRPSPAQGATTTNPCSLSVPSVAHPGPLPSSSRITLNIPPLSPKYKPADLPLDAKPEDVARLTERHVLERVPPTEKKKYPSKRCKVCLRRSGYGYSPNPGRKHPKETVYYCPHCPSRPGLCSYPCYYIYHSKLNYWEPDDAESRMGGGRSSSSEGMGFLSSSDSLTGGLGLGSGLGPFGSMYGGMGGAGPALSSMYGAEFGFGAHHGGGGAGIMKMPEAVLGDGSDSNRSHIKPEGSGDVLDLDAESRGEHKHCPLPVYGESVYGPGSR